MIRDVFEHLDITPGMRTLDVGCGGGYALRMMLERGAEAVGVDYSAASVVRTSAKVAEYIERGKAQVDCASVQDLPYADESFDLVTAFETVYFWPEMENSLKEVYRVLRSGGHFVIAVEAWKEDDKINCPAFFLQNLKMTVYAPEELEEMLLIAGFSAVENIKAKNSKWLAIHTEKKTRAA